MHTLLLFFKKTATFFEFLLLELVAFLLIMQNDGYQGNVLLSSCNRAVATVYAWADAVTDYLFLSPENRRLAAENTALQERVLALEEQLAEATFCADSSQTTERDYTFVSAKTIYNTVASFQNYIVIDKGAADGIVPEMGVVEPSGVVGIVKTVSQHFATVLPLLNVQSRVSCRIGRGGSFGSLVWDADDARFAKLEEVPRHVEIVAGDSIFTSGLSAVFPEGFLVGVVEQSHLEQSAANHDITVRLACDFRRVNYVKVVRYTHREELNEMVEGIEK